MVSVCFFVKIILQAKHNSCTVWLARLIESSCVNAFVEIESPPSTSALQMWMSAGAPVSAPVVNVWTHAAHTSAKHVALDSGPTLGDVWVRGSIWVFRISFYDCVIIILFPQSGMGWKHRLGVGSVPHDLRRHGDSVCPLSKCWQAIFFFFFRIVMRWLITCVRFSVKYYCISKQSRN